MYDSSPLIKGDKKGFTFIEVMIAMAIISGVIVTLITSLNLHMGYVDSSTNSVKAVMLGSEKLKELEGPSSPGVESGDFGPDNKDFNWSYSTTPTNFTGVVRGRVTVTWGSGGEITLSSYKAD